MMLICVPTSETAFYMIYTTVIWVTFGGEKLCKVGENGAAPNNFTGRYLCHPTVAFNLHRYDISSTKCQWPSNSERKWMD